MGVYDNTDQVIWTMNISLPKVPKFRDDWLRDVNEVIDIFLAKLFSNKFMAHK